MKTLNRTSSIQVNNKVEAIKKEKERISLLSILLFIIMGFSLYISSQSYVKFLNLTNTVILKEKDLASLKKEIIELESVKNKVLNIRETEKSAIEKGFIYNKDIIYIKNK